MTPRKVVVHIATSADGYIARPDGTLDWLTDRPAPKGFYGLPAFERTVDAKIVGRRTYDAAVAMGARFGKGAPHYVFSRQPAPSAPAGVTFVDEPPARFADGLRAQPGQTIWLMGGGSLIGAFLDDGAIDEFVVTIVPVLIGEGIPLIAPRHRQVALELIASTPFPDGVVQVHYRVASARSRSPRSER